MCRVILAVVLIVVGLGMAFAGLAAKGPYAELVLWGLGCPGVLLLFVGAFLGTQNQKAINESVTSNDAPSVPFSWDNVGRGAQVVIAFIAIIVIACIAINILSMIPGDILFTLAIGLSIFALVGSIIVRGLNLLGSNTQ